MKIAEDNTTPSLFSIKENYLLSCTPSGKLQKMMALSATQRKKMEHNNMHLTEGMTTTDINGFPVLQPYLGDIDYDFVPFSERNRVNPREFGIHFFEDDYKFRAATWDRLDQTIYKLRNFRSITCPDHSLYIEEDMYSFLNKQSIYRSRFAGACCQLRGYDVIPTASWGGADSFEYCFEGLPIGSIIALCGIGIDSCRLSLELWEYGVRELEARLSPKALFICGNERKVPGLSTPTVFIPPHVSFKFKG